MFRNTQKIKDVATLSLNTRDISTLGDVWFRTESIDNEIGTIFQLQSGAVWKNINLYNLLGPEIYNKYNIFRLQLTQYMFNLDGTVSGASFNTNDEEFRNLSMYIYGPNFYNSQYDVKSGNKKSVVHLTNITTQYTITTAQPGGTSSLNANSEYFYDVNETEGMSVFFNKTRTMDIAIRYGPMSEGRYTSVEDTSTTNGVYDFWKAGRSFILKFNIIPVE